MAEPSRTRRRTSTPNGPTDDGNPFGTPEAELNLARRRQRRTRRCKRQALAAHASQVTDIGMLLAMPEEVFAAFFGTEWYIEPGAEPGLRDGWLLEGA